MNGFEVTHPWNHTDDTVLLVYNTSIDTKIFTFQLPGWCVVQLVILSHTHSLSNSKSGLVHVDPSLVSNFFYVLFLQINVY